MLIEHLQWDSEFFGLKIGQCHFKKGTQKLPDTVSDWDLVYFYLEPEDAQGVAIMNSSKAILADKKVTYRLSNDCAPDDEKGISPGIIDYQSSELDEKVIRLGMQSSQYSRFRTDKRFAPGKCEEMYALWMKRSIERKLATHVLVAMGGGNVVSGVMTLKAEPDFWKIGLLAVDEKDRGNNIGKKLLMAGESLSASGNAKAIRVVTQQENVAACSFYESCGFELESTVFVFHYWN